MISYIRSTTTTFDVWKKLVVISQSLFGINGSIVAISLPYCCSRWRLWETIGATALPSPQQQLRNEERATKIDRQQTAGSKSVAEELEIGTFGCSSYHRSNWDAFPSENDLIRKEGQGRLCWLERGTGWRLICKQYCWFGMSQTRISQACHFHSYLRKTYSIHHHVLLRVVKNPQHRHKWNELK